MKCDICRTRTMSRRSEVLVKKGWSLFGIVPVDENCFEFKIKCCQIVLFLLQIPLFTNFHAFSIIARSPLFWNNWPSCVKPPTGLEYFAPDSRKTFSGYINLWVKKTKTKNKLQSNKCADLKTVGFSSWKELSASKFHLPPCVSWSLFKISSYSHTFNKRQVQLSPPHFATNESY